ALPVEVVPALRQHLVEQLREEARRVALEPLVEDLLVQPRNGVDAVVVVEADTLAAAVLVVEDEVDVTLRLAAEVHVRQPDAVSWMLDHSMSPLCLEPVAAYCRATRRSPCGVSARSTSSNTPCTSSASSAA